MTDDRVGEASALFAENLKKALAGRGMRNISRATGITVETLRHLIAGRIVPDLGDVVALEEALDADLWPVLPEGHLSEFGGQFGEGGSVG